MQKREFDARTETKSSLSRQVLERQRDEHEARDARLPQRGPFAPVISGIGDASSAGVHASMLNRATNGRPSRAGQSLLRLQKQYGNRYVQRVLALARKGAGETEAAPDVEQAIQRSRGGGQALDSEVRSQMEPAFGADFSGVRVHTGAQSDTLNRELNARAFTTGQDIFFRQDAYNPGNSSGRELIAHELTHVVQQNGDKVQHKLTVGQPGDKYEQEADQVARAVMHQEQRAVQRESDEGFVRRHVEEEEEEVQMKSEYSRVQRQVEEEEEEIQAKLEKKGVQRQTEEEETLQAKEISGQASAANQKLGADTALRIANQRRAGQRPAPETRSEMDVSIGHDFGVVGIHANASAEGPTMELVAKGFPPRNDVLQRERNNEPDSWDKIRSLGRDYIRDFWYNNACDALDELDKELPKWNYDYVDFLQDAQKFISFLSPLISTTVRKSEFLLGTMDVAAFVAGTIQRTPEKEIISDIKDNLINIEAGLKALVESKEHFFEAVMKTSKIHKHDLDKAVWYAIFPDMNFENRVQLKQSIKADAFNKIYQTLGGSVAHLVHAQTESKTAAMGEALVATERWAASEGKEVIEKYILLKDHPSRRRSYARIIAKHFNNTYEQIYTKKYEATILKRDPLRLVAGPYRGRFTVWLVNHESAIIVNSSPAIQVPWSKAESTYKIYQLVLR